MQNNKGAPEVKTIADLKTPSRELANMPDQKVDMFSTRGFSLAQRIAQAFATSDAVPAIFQAQTPKKVKGEIVAWVENPAAFGNCLVAIETAQAVGMSITAVMQNANIIEGKLSWSGKFIIAAVNASRRFTPLRFDIQELGNIKAKYKEKDGWNDQKKKYNMIEHEVELENIVWRAWALPYGMEFPKGVVTLQQAKDAGLPVIVGPRVSMRLAVEEGWYAKPGSKWQTEMKDLMGMYRAGSYFGNIHAPDVVMGMGRSSEELQDMSNTIDVQQQESGQYVATNLDILRAGMAPAETERHPHAETVEVRERQDNEPADLAETEQPKAADATGETVAASAESETANPKYDSVLKQINEAKDVDSLADVADLMKDVPDAMKRDQLAAAYRARHAALIDSPAPAAEAAAPAKRARRTSGPVE